MPRSCSSGRRSVSVPVSARTSQVLPWSMCPAVPTVSATDGTLPPETIPAARQLRHVPDVGVHSLLGPEPARQRSEHLAAELLPRLRILDGDDVGRAAA